MYHFGKSKLQSIVHFKIEHNIFSILNCILYMYTTYSYNSYMNIKHSFSQTDLTSDNKQNKLITLYHFVV